jgi:hypothetical protein
MLTIGGNGDIPKLRRSGGMKATPKEVSGEIETILPDL